MQISKQGMWKGYHSPIEGVRKGYLSRKKWYIKGQGVGPRDGASPYKNLLNTPPPPPGPGYSPKWTKSGANMGFALRYLILLQPFIPYDEVILFLAHIMWTEDD